MTGEEARGDGGRVLRRKQDRPGDFEGKIVSAEKARKELGWEPKTDFEEGIRKYYEWYKKYNMDKSKS